MATINLGNVVGADGATGATGLTGTNGTNGVNGTNGTNGTDGDDGAIGAVPNIDFTIDAVGHLIFETDGTTSSGAAAGGGDLVKIAAQSFSSGITSLTFTDCFTDDYASYKVICTNLQGTESGSGIVHGLFSTDSGATYLSAYGYVGTTQATLRISGGYDMGSGTGQYRLHQEFLISGSRDPNSYTLCHGHMNRINLSGISDYGQDVRCSLKSTVVVNTFKLYANSDVLVAGTVAIYGIKA